MLIETDKFKQVGAPEDVLPPINILALINKGCKLEGSLIGSPADISEMLQFAADKKIHPYIQERPMSDANQAIINMEEGDARYRYVLVNEKNVKELKASL